MASSPLITLATDFGVQTHGIAMMHGVIYEICPAARVLDLAHGLPSFNLMTGARTLETVHSLPKGFHVCVVDPGVGTERRVVAIEAGRGDFLVGPDNGVLLPATRFLGGVKRVAAITNEKYMRVPVSPIFHGRDVFAPAAAHLANGVVLEELGPALEEGQLAKAPYEEAEMREGVVHARVLSVNKVGSVHLNVRQEAAAAFGLKQGTDYDAYFGDRSVTIPFRNTFGDVPKGEIVMFDDDFGRIEVALNRASLAEKHKLAVGSEVRIIL